MGELRNTEPGRPGNEIGKRRVDSMHSTVLYRIIPF